MLLLLLLPLLLLLLLSLTVEPEGAMLCIRPACRSLLALGPMCKGGSQGAGSWHWCRFFWCLLPAQ